MPLDVWELICFSVLTVVILTSMAIAWRKADRVAKKGPVLKMVLAEMRFVAICAKAESRIGKCYAEYQSFADDFGSNPRMTHALRYAEQQYKSQRLALIEQMNTALDELRSETEGAVPNLVAVLCERYASEYAVIGLARKA
ncbi:MAG: hypothetical protein AAFZ67_13235 [Planctomycetota bacterium]